MPLNSLAKQYDTNIGVVSFPSHIAKMVTVAPHLGVSLTVHQVNNPDDIEKGCYEMRDKGMKVLLAAVTPCSGHRNWDCMAYCIRFPRTA